MQAREDNGDDVDSSNGDESNQIENNSEATDTNTVVIDIHNENAYYTPNSNSRNLESNIGSSSHQCSIQIGLPSSRTEDKDATETNKNGDGVFELPSYEESQREHSHLDGELPPPYQNDLQTDLSQTRAASSAPTRQHRQRRTQVSFGDFPTRTRCKYCHEVVTTRLNHVPGTLTFIIMLLIFFLGGFLFCCLIPLCIPGLKDVQHRCPNCNFVLGYYHRIG